MRMSFDEWINLTPDDEKDTLCLMDAWKAGALAMFDRLLDMFEEDLKELIGTEVNALREGSNNE